MHGSESLDPGPHLLIHGLFYVDALRRLVSETLLRHARVQRHRAVLLRAHRVSVDLRLHLAKLIDARLKDFLTRDEAVTLFAGIVCTRGLMSFVLILILTHFGTLL